MNILIAYYSKTGSTERVATALKRSLEKEHRVTLFRVKPQRELKAHEYKKGEKDLPLQQPFVDLRGFDLVFVGTPVWSFCPTPIMVSYLRKLRNAKGKRFALFATCMALPGTTIKRMSNILSTKGAVIVDSMTLKSIFELDEKKMQEAQRFARNLLPKL